MARGSSPRKPDSRPSTFSASLNKLLRPLLKDAKREAEINVSRGVRGKVVTLSSGHKLLVIEQKGADIWRGGAKSVAAAIEADTAGLGVDNVVLQRAAKLEIPLVAVVIEELHQLAMTSMADFFDPELVRTRANYRGRSIRIVPYQRFQHRFLKPPLRKRKLRAIE